MGEVSPAVRELAWEAVNTWGWAERRGPAVTLRDRNGERRVAYTKLDSFDSMLTHCANPEDGAELLLLRERLRDWRFYDHFRTDSEAPSRRRQERPAIRSRSRPSATSLMVKSNSLRATKSSSSQACAQAA